MKCVRWLVPVLLVASLVAAVFAPSSPAQAADPYGTEWELLGLWEDPPDDPSQLDIAGIGLWGTTDRQILSFEFAMNKPFAGYDLGNDQPSTIRLLLDTDCREATGYHPGDGLGGDAVLAFFFEEFDYYAELWATPSDNTSTWYFVDEFPAYADETHPTQSIIGVEFPASALGNPNRIYFDGYARWISPSQQEFDDWIPDVEFAEAAIVDSGGFTDVDPGHPFASAIQRLADAGIINGYTDHSYKPDNPVWRQHFAKMIVRTLDIPTSATTATRFTDLGQPDALGYPHIYVQAAYEHGITRGVDSAQTRFDPYADITRAQLITMVVRALDTKHPGLLASPPNWFTSAWGDFSHDHQANARKAHYNGLLMGLPIHDLDPWGPMPRGEVAQVLANVLALLDEGAPSADLHDIRDAIAASGSVAVDFTIVDYLISQDWTGDDWVGVIIASPGLEDCAVVLQRTRPTTWTIVDLGTGLTHDDVLGYGAPFAIADFVAP